QHVGVVDLLLGQEFAPRRGADALPDVALGGARRDRDALQDLFGRGGFGVDEAGRSERDLLALEEHPLLGAVAPAGGPVEAAEIAEQKLPIGRAQDLRVLLRYDAIEDLDGVVGVASNRVDRPQLEFLPLFGGNEDELGHENAIHLTPRALAL